MSRAHGASLAKHAKGASVDTTQKIQSQKRITRSQSREIGERHESEAGDAVVTPSRVRRKAAGKFVYFIFS